MLIFDVSLPSIVLLPPFVALLVWSGEFVPYTVYIVLSEFCKFRGIVCGFAVLFAKLKKKVMDQNNKN